jgi:RND family efflux transporter MFP subunit
MKHLLALVLLMLAGCSSPDDEEASPEPVALVGLVRARPGSVESAIAVYGSAEPDEDSAATLSAPVEAIVAAIDAPAGSAVGRGQIVVRLASSPASRLELARATAEADAARRAFARAQRLRADGLVGDAEVETARAAARSAAAAETSFAVRTSALALRAPIAGHVSTVSVAPGSLVPAGAVVATISGGGDLRARFGVDPELARRIPTGVTLRVRPSAGGAPFAVPVLSVDPTADPQTRLASLFVRIPAAAGIGAGEPLAGELLLQTRAGALTVPYAALLDEGGQSYVYTVEGGVAHRRDVEIGPTDGARIVILAGLRPGAAVVVAGVTALEDGMQVRTR